MYKIAPLNGWLWNAFRLNESVNALDVDKMRAPDNVVVINTEADFPVQDATTITLSANTAYILGFPVVTAKRFIVQNAVSLTSYTNFVLTLTYTGTDTMFTAVGNFAIFNLRYSCPTATVFNYTGAGQLQVERSNCLACANIGTVTSSGTTSLNWTNNSFPTITGQGLQFIGTFFVISITKLFMSGSSAAFVGIDLGTSSIYNIEIENAELFGVSGSVGLKGLANSANMQANSVATVRDANFAGTLMTPLSGIAATDIRWDFRGNSKIEDTMDDAIGYFSANAVDTVITASSTNGSNAVKVAGTWTAGRVSKFSLTTTGRVTYLAERTTTAPIDVSLHLTSVGGGSVRCKIYLAKNGVIIAAAATATDLAGNTSKNVTLPWQITFALNDYIEVFVENQTNANDILVEDAVLRIR